MAQEENSTVGLGTHEVPQDLIVRHILLQMLVVFYNIIGPSIGIFGCVTNVINMVVFAKMGIQDSVTLSFFVLSSSDFVMSTFLFIRNVCNALYLSGTAEPISMTSVAGIMFWYMSIFLDMSMLTTVYIAVVRCCCVALPFTFKSSFTVRRTALVLAIITLACVIIRIPQLSTTGLSWQTNPVTNTTRFTFYVSDNFVTINSVISFIDRAVLPVTVMSVVLVCSIILTRSLVRASRVRKQMTGGEKKLSNQERTIKTVSNVTIETERTNNKVFQDFDPVSQSNRNDGDLSEKEVRLVKAVVLVAIFLLMSTFVMSVQGLAVTFVYEYYAGRKHSATFFVVSSIEECFIQINASLNVFIYWNFNHRFRKVSKTIFLRDSE